MFVGKYDLIIDPGHGGADPGGGHSVDPKWSEKDMVLQISLYQYERCKELGIHAALTRDRDVTLTRDARIAKVKEGRYCISNHTNAAIFSARGAETIHSIHTSDKLANSILDEIVAEGMAKRRVFTKVGANGQDYYYMIRETRPTETVIIEYGFGTNPYDAKLLHENWKLYAEAALRGWCKHVGHAYNPPKEDDQMDVPKIQRKASVVINDKWQDAYIIDNVTYVPLRFVTESLGGRVDRWDNENKVAYISKGE